MIRMSFFRTVFLTGMLGLSVSNLHAQQTLTLDLYDQTCVKLSDTIAGSYDRCAGGGFWAGTYDSISYPKLCFGKFDFSRTAGSSIYSYWGGFTFGTNGDNLCYSGKCPVTCGCRPANPNCSLSGSNAWVENQWGVMAGGGLNPSYNTVKGVPYMIAYWDYWMDNQGTPSLEVKLDDGSLFAPQEIWICNHPWPYYGNIYGDGFARPLDSIGDYFLLRIHGLDAGGNEIGYVEHFLATNEGSVDGTPVTESPNWEQVSLLQLGGNVKTLYFTMESSDNSGQYGPNTAVYFNMDKLKVTVTGKAPAKAVVQKTKTAAANATKTPEIKDYFPIPSYTGGEVFVYDAKGNEVLKTTVKAGEKVNLSKLPAGEYRLQHGHRYIPIKKVK